MTGRYEPSSAFLRAVIAEEVPLSGSPLAEANLRHLIACMRDDDVSNRDWATLLVATEDADSPQIRRALLTALSDPELVVRAEAMAGLARRDPAAALPHVIDALSGDCACMAVFEAAQMIADPRLVDPLRPWTLPSDDQYLDTCAREAMIACESGGAAS